jgi:hypothetical protein
MKLNNEKEQEFKEFMENFINRKESNFDINGVNFLSIQKNGEYIELKVKEKIYCAFSIESQKLKRNKIEINFLKGLIEEIILREI